MSLPWIIVGIIGLAVSLHSYRTWMWEWIEMDRFPALGALECVAGMGIAVLGAIMALP